MKRLVAVLLCAFLCTASLCFGDDVTAEYRIGIDDVLDISVWNVPELQKTMPVRPDGKISLPLVNDIVAAGLTPMELRDQLTKKIAVYVHNPDVSVMVKEIHSLKISVLGQVKTPGQYELKGRSSVLDALALAGGLTEFAARRRITVLRQSARGVQRLNFDFDAAVSAVNPAFHVLLKGGDVVVVP